MHPSVRPQLMALAQVAGADYPHALDLPYRLASWALDDSANIRLWWDEAGTLRAFAICQTPWFLLDLCLHPGSEAAQLAEMVAWGRARGQQLAHIQQRPLPLFVLSRAGTALTTQLATLGFAPDGWGAVHLVAELAQRPPAPPLPPGFTLRALRGASEVAAAVELHHAAFSTQSMTPAWRRRTLRAPEYRAELDLLVEAPDGRQAAFCLGWLHPGARVGKIEPLGVHPDFRRRGLGRALLLEMGRRLAALGARAVGLDTSNNNSPALALYRSVGFRPRAQWGAYGQWFHPENSE